MSILVIKLIYQTTDMFNHLKAVKIQGRIVRRRFSASWVSNVRGTHNRLGNIHKSVGIVVNLL